MTYLYHYTSKENFNSILREGVIKAKNDGASYYAAGVYFTDLPPSTPDNQLLWNNYNYGHNHLQSTELLPKIECYFRIHSSDLDGVMEVPTTNPKRRSWIVEGNVYISRNGMKVTHGERKIDNTKIVPPFDPDMVLNDTYQLSSVVLSDTYKLSRPDHYQYRREQMREEVRNYATQNSHMGMLAGPYHNHSLIWQQRSMSQVVQLEEMERALLERTPSSVYNAGNTPQAQASRSSAYQRLQLANEDVTPRKTYCNGVSYWRHLFYGEEYINIRRLDDTDIYPNGRGISFKASSIKDMLVDILNHCTDQEVQDIISRVRN